MGAWDDSEWLDAHGGVKAAAKQMAGSLQREADEYLERAAVSKDGDAVIVRLTPSQAGRFLDMIYEDRD